MTAAFATLVNDSDTDITGQRGVADVPDGNPRDDHAGREDADAAQAGRLVINAGTHALGPGGDHLMLMDLPARSTPATSSTSP